ncbi:hypothetical protein [Paractinoplanes ovalisporus]|nr:hypothetical protein [Actinoplanes ovalisporus]
MDNWDHGRDRIKDKEQGRRLLIVYALVALAMLVIGVVTGFLK